MRKCRLGGIALFLAVSQLAVSSSVLSAQMMGPPDTTAGSPKGVTAIIFGVQGMDVEDFNAALRANGFPTMDRSAIVSGLASAIRFGRWDLSFSGGTILGGRDQSPSWRTKLSGQSLLVGVGFAVLEKGKWRLVPNGGVGLTRVGFHVEQRRGGTVDSALADPLRGTDLDGQTWIWHAGLGLDYKLGRWKGRKIGVGLRAGYAEQFGETGWRADQNDLSTGPRAGVGGPYGRLGLSVGLPRRGDAIFTTLASLIPWLSR